MSHVNTAAPSTTTINSNHDNNPFSERDAFPPLIDALGAGAMLLSPEHCRIHDTRSSSYILKTTPLHLSYDDDVHINNCKERIDDCQATLWARAHCTNDDNGDGDEVMICPTTPPRQNDADDNRMNTCIDSLLDSPIASSDSPHILKRTSLLPSPSISRASQSVPRLRAT